MPPIIIDVYSNIICCVTALSLLIDFSRIYLSTDLSRILRGPESIKAISGEKAGRNLQIYLAWLIFLGCVDEMGKAKRLRSNFMVSQEELQWKFILQTDMFLNGEKSNEMLVCVGVDICFDFPNWWIQLSWIWIKWNHKQFRLMSPRANVIIKLLLPAHTTCVCCSSSSTFRA